MNMSDYMIFRRFVGILQTSPYVPPLGTGGSAHKSAMLEMEGVALNYLLFLWLLPLLLLLLLLGRRGSYHDVHQSQVVVALTFVRLMARHCEPNYCRRAAVSSPMLGSTLAGPGDCGAVVPHTGDKGLAASNRPTHTHWHLPDIRDDVAVLGFVLAWERSYA